LQKAPTIKDIARLCGVSEGTVDRAINNRPGINEITRHRVLEVAKLLNYRPNRIAQSLATGKTNTIGIICFDLHNNFFSSLIDIIEANAKSHEYFVNLVLTHRDIKKEIEGIQYLVERNVDGIIIFPVGKGENYVELLKSTKKPIVTLYNKINDDFAHIGVDDRNAMFDAVKHIKSKGYERIYFITPAISKQEKNGLNVYTLKRRLKGYIDGIKAFGLNHEPLVVEGRDFDKVFSSLDLKQKTAMLCICDTYALDTIKYLRDRNFRVPEDIGIMGYDNIEVLKYVQPQLSTVEYHVEKMGNLAFSTLFDMINGKQVQSEQLLDYYIIEGETI
jgi:LacI family transcriptional regulator